MDVTTDLLVLPSLGSIDEILGTFSNPIDLTKGSYKKLEFRFKNNGIQLLHNGIDIKIFSTVWLTSFWGVKDLAYAIKLYLDHFGTPHTHVEKSTSKITDQMKFALSKILTPPTFFVYTQDISGCIEEIEEICGYPLIIKDTKGSRGKHSAYIKNRKEFLKKLSGLPKYRKYFFQKFIPNEYDWGVLVANGQVVSAEKSYSSDGEFRNNTCNGAEEVFVEIKDIPNQVQEMAIKASEALGLSWSRSDIIIDKNTGTPYLLEVNRFPGVTSGTSEVTGAQQFLKSHLTLISD